MTENRIIHESQVTVMEFHEKILAVQKATHALNLRPEATGQVQTRNYKYLTIQKLHEAVLPILFKQGLTWICAPTFNDTMPALSYTLSDGEHELTDVMPLVKCEDMQKLGSAITYARRYALLAVLGLTPDEDDDGATASKPATRQRQGTPKIPRDRAVKIKAQAEAAGLWPDGAAAPALTAYIVGTGCEAGKISNLNVDQAEDVEGWIAKEADGVEKY